MGLLAERKWSSFSLERKWLGRNMPRNRNRMPMRIILTRLVNMGAY